MNPKLQNSGNYVIVYDVIGHDVIGHPDISSDIAGLALSDIENRLVIASPQKKLWPY